jgi:hypothetical protein
LCLRVEFESSRVHELLKSPEAHEWIGVEQ